MKQPSEDGSIGPAALWRRVLARGIDYLAIFWLLFALDVIGVTFWVAKYTDRVTPTPWGSSFVVITTLAGFYAVLEVVYIAKRGQTPAKELLKIRVVRVDRVDPPGWQTALQRWWLPGLAFALPWWGALAAFAALGLPATVDPQRRTLYDRLSHTVVVPYDAKKVEGPIATRRRSVNEPVSREMT